MRRRQLAAWTRLADRSGWAEWQMHGRDLWRRVKTEELDIGTPTTLGQAWVPSRVGLDGRWPMLWPMADVVARG
eukprot:6084372-Prymnesium_polylepis.1